MVDWGEGVDVGSMWGRCEGRCEVDVGSMCGRCVRHIRLACAEISDYTGFFVI